MKGSECRHCEHCSIPRSFFHLDSNVIRRRRKIEVRTQIVHLENVATPHQAALRWRKHSLAYIWGFNYCRFTTCSIRSMFVLNMRIRTSNTTTSLLISDGNGTEIGALHEIADEDEIGEEGREEEFSLCKVYSRGLILHPFVLVKMELYDHFIRFRMIPLLQSSRPASIS